MRAILVNSTEKEINVIDIKGNNYREIAKLIGCSTIASGYSFKNNDFMYVDDEGLFTDNDNGFIIHQEGNTWGMQKLIGNALIVGSDEDGNDLDAVSTVDEVKSIIKFCKLYL